MPGTKVSRTLQSLLTKRADAAVSYQKAKLQLAELHVQIVRQGLKEGLVLPGDIGEMYW
jgi:hypothetical protein